MKTEPVKKIYIRRTRTTERFTDKDLFFAWVSGEPAGTMAESDVAALQKLCKGRDELRKCEVVFQG